MRIYSRMKVVPTADLFDEWDRGECHLAATGTCSLELAPEVNFFSNQENHKTYCQQLRLGLKIGSKFDEMEIVNTQVNTSYEHYISMLRFYFSHPHAFENYYTKYMNDEFLSYVQEFIKIIKEEVSSLYKIDSPDISKEIMERCFRLGIMHSKFATDDEFPNRLKGGGEELSDGHHRSCVALRSESPYMWIAEIEYD